MADPILVVDDERTILELFRIVVGDHVEVADSATAAIAAIEARQFACVVSDKNLPDGDGFQVLQAAREKQPHCACIMMTGFSSSGSAIAALRLGVNDYFEKPFADVNVLQPKIEAAIRNQRAHYEGQQLLEKVQRYGTEIDMFEELLALKLREAKSETEQVIRRVKTASVVLGELMMLANAATQQEMAVATCERIGAQLERVLVELELATRRER